jgi:hypothetical protein
VPLSRRVFRGPRLKPWGTWKRLQNCNCKYWLGELWWRSGFLRCATDGEAVRRFGRNDSFLGRLERTCKSKSWRCGCIHSHPCRGETAPWMGHPIFFWVLGKNGQLQLQQQRQQQQQLQLQQQRQLQLQQQLQQQLQLQLQQQRQLQGSFASLRMTVGRGASKSITRTDGFCRS